MLLPLVQTYIFNIAIGAKPQDVPIAVLNNEISLAHCYPHVYSGCFFDRNITFSSSCLFLKYLKKEKYKIVRIIYQYCLVPISSEKFIFEFI